MLTNLQGYVVCPSEKRFMLLFTFIKKNKDKKVMVFFSTCKAVKFHAELFNYVDIPVKDIHVSKVLPPFAPPSDMSLPLLYLVLLVGFKSQII